MTLQDCDALTALCNGYVQQQLVTENESYVTVGPSENKYFTSYSVI